jgi:hypothetical protein
LTIKGAAASNQGIDVVHTNGNTVAQLIHGGTGDEGQLSLLDSNSTTVLIRGEVGATSYFNAGNVGIGTTAPVATLEVKGGQIVLNTTSANSSAVIFRINDVTKGYIGPAGILGGSDNDMGYRVESGNNQAFYIGASERARIDSSGRLLVGTSTSIDSNALIQAYQASGAPNIALKSDSLANDQATTYTVTGVANGGSRYGSLGVYKHSGITNPCSYLALSAEDNVVSFVWADNSDQLRISTTASHIGTTSGTVVGAQTSDERIKNILGPVTYGLEEIKQLDPVSYALKSDPEQVPHLGFIAQQVNPIIPESVFDTDEVIEEGEPTKLGMEYVALIPVLVNAIKELSAEVDALKAQLQAS